MSQPEWEFVDNLGDVNPIEHGGLFIFRDKTGVYDPEMMQLESVGGDTESEYNEHGEIVVEGDEQWEVRRAVIKPCTYINGILSENPSHPDKPAWFANTPAMQKKRPQDGTNLANICGSMDVEEQELIRMFCSDDIVERAFAWRMVGDYHGWENLGGDLIEYDDRRELEEHLKELGVPI